MHSRISNIPDVLLHPCDLLPPCDDEFQIVVFLERGPKWRQAIVNKARKKKFNGHVFIGIRGRNLPVRLITFEPRYLTGEGIPVHKLPPVGEEGLEVPNTEGQSPLCSLTRTVTHFQGFKKVEGEISYDSDSATLIDTAHIFPISEEQYRKALEKAESDRHIPQTYQLVGFKENNCVRYTCNFLESIGIDVPLLWRVLPWPCMVSLSLGFDNVMKEIFGQMPDKRIPVTPDDVRRNMVRQFSSNTLSAVA